MENGNIIAAEIAALKREKKAVIMAHYYQRPEIQDIADYIGDSLGLAQQAAKQDAEIIVVAGVYFMGETAKILNPSRKVLVPDVDAGCSLADNCPAPEFRAFIAEHPGYVVVTYVNCTAEVKAMSDILCTSANAERVINSIPRGEKIIFAPDRHLGRFLMKKTGRDLVLWPGSCIVHENFDAKALIRLKARHPGAVVLAHPECPEQILDLADFIASTTGLLAHVEKSAAREFIVATEAGILHQMRKACPDKTFYLAETDESTCSCSECRYMKLNTLEKVRSCLAEERPEVTLPQEILEKALLPLSRMLEVSR